VSDLPTPSRKILVVDDDPFMRDSTRQYLEAFGLEVRIADSAQAMDRLTVREDFHLIVLDVLLPGEDGLSICKHFRANGNNTTIIMVTGKCEDADCIVGLEMAADDYLVKPFNPRELQARITAVLKRVPEPTHHAAPLDQAAP
jgi:two-component system, OmpR family, phosphate regulon response regulator OmpR